MTTGTTTDVGTYRIIRSEELAAAELAMVESLAVLRAAGRGRVRHRLECLVNAGILGVAGADKVYFDAFGGHLKAVKVSKTARIVGWLKGQRA